MDSPDNKTQMTNTPKQTQMVSADAPKMVLVRTNYPIRVMDEKGNEHIYTEGQEALLTEAQAKDFCDKEFDLGIRNYFGHYDERAMKTQKVRRATRL